VRLDLARERRVDRQLVDAPSELGEVGAGLLDPLLLRPLLGLLEAAPVAPVDAQAHEPTIAAITSTEPAPRPAWR
jgi:hypothetical protein